MKLMRKGVAAAAIAGSLLAGGALGATVFGAASSGAATSTTTVAAPSGSGLPATPPAGAQGPPGGPQAGTFKSNEDPTHEAGESKQREAEETAGKFPKTSP